MHIKTANGKKTILMSHREWKAIGRQAGWASGLSDVEIVKQYWDKISERLPDLSLDAFKQIESFSSDLSRNYTKTAVWEAKYESPSIYTNEPLATSRIIALEDPPNTAHPNTNWRVVGAIPHHTLDFNSWEEVIQFIGEIGLDFDPGKVLRRQNGDDPFDGRLGDPKSVEEEGV